MRSSVYSPGAGTLPRVLVGRDALLQALAWRINEVATEGRRRTQDVILVGPRGVGKTVVLTRYAAMAAQAGFEVINLQAVVSTHNRQPTLIRSLLDRAGERAAQREGPWRRTKHLFDRLGSVSFGIAGFNLGVTTLPSDRAPAPLDPSVLAGVLDGLAAEVRKDAPNGGVLITVDEMQASVPDDLALLAAALHRLNVERPSAAVVCAGTGLPHTLQALGDAGVTHPDRLFDFERLPLALTPGEAAFAILEPARQVGVTWHPDAVTAVVSASGGYPAHVQLFADRVWRVAPGPHEITAADAAAGLGAAQAELDSQTFGRRFEQLTDRQVEYLAALAVLGGAASSAAIGRALGRSLQELSVTRDALIRAGDVYSPARGRLVLAVPMLGDYVLRHYDDARANAAVPLVDRAAMARNTGS